jgi:cysteinyl-tRNA synthetase
LHDFLKRAERELKQTQFAQLDDSIQLPAGFVDEMNNDLNVPAALAVIHDAVTAGNKDLDEQQWREAAQKRAQVNRMLSILGLAPSQWVSAANEEHSALDKLVKRLIEQRELARQEKNFELADSIRRQLEESGIELSDGPTGTHWSVN